MSIRNKKNKNRTNNYNYDNPHYRSYTAISTSKDVSEIAFKVFGSLYYTPKK
jgi:hypothetical protein